jgi:hypothetical protein
LSTEPSAKIPVAEKQIHRRRPVAAATESPRRYCAFGFSLAGGKPDGAKLGMGCRLLVASAARVIGTLLA